MMSANQHNHRHAHPHAHDHDHGADPLHHHDHGREFVPMLNEASLAARRAFAVGIGLNMVFVIIEASFGVASGSMALLADASHNFGDVIGLVLAWLAAHLSLRRPSKHYTYGLGSTSILAALGNAMLLMVAVGAILWASVERLGQPETVNSAAVMAVAGAGVVINFATALLFVKLRRDDLNVRGAYLHMAGDALVSAGVVVAAALQRLTGWTWVDPITGILIGLFILAATWALLKDALRLALHAVPPGVDPAAVRQFLCTQPGVGGAHDLHIWAMSTTESAMTAHLVMPEGYPGDAFLCRIADEIADRFKIQHVTLQVETGGTPACRLVSHA